jgi:hypothetical protein
MRNIFKLTAALALIIVLGLAGKSLPQTPTPLPTIAQPTPTPTATPSQNLTRAFHCSCWASGQPPAWSGQVLGTSFSAARLAASGQCLRFNNAKPVSPFIPPPSASFGFNSRIIPTPQPPFFNPCGVCACN